MTEVLQPTSDYSTFLRLMTAQLQNQDPLAPMDATQFVTQLAQFSQVEQSVQTNTKLDELLTRISTSNVQSAVSMIGRKVEVESSALTLADRQAPFKLSVEGEPASLMYFVRDAEGAVVARREVTYAGERQSVIWDGKTDNGEALADGLYTIEVYAQDANGNALMSHSFTNRTISQVVNDPASGTSFVLDSGEIVGQNSPMWIS